MEHPRCRLIKSFSTVPIERPHRRRAKRIIDTITRESRRKLRASIPKLSASTSNQLRELEARSGIGVVSLMALGLTINFLEASAAERLRIARLMVPEADRESIDLTCAGLERQIRKELCYHKRHSQAEA
jgi:hypothetical protein